MNLKHFLILLSVNVDLVIEVFFWGGTIFSVVSHVKENVLVGDTIIFITEDQEVAKTGFYSVASRMFDDELLGVEHDPSTSPTIDSTNRMNERFFIKYN